MVKDQYKKGIVTIHCNHRTEFYKLIKWVKTQGDFENIWHSNDPHPIYHTVLRPCVCIDWRYMELDIGSTYSYKNIVEYNDAVLEEFKSDN